jgi:2-oxoglutarate ferredoxin oxidoreductase subunit alpha
MRRDVFTFLVGGRAGQGVKKAGAVASRLFAHMGRQVFQMDDYQSLIRGGHNFSVVSTSRSEISSHYMKADLVVALDERSRELHSQHLRRNGLMICDADSLDEAQACGVSLTSEARKHPDPELRYGVGAVAALAAALGFGKERLQEIITHEYSRDVDHNIAYASAIYDVAHPIVGDRFDLKEGDGERPLLYGNEAIALGAAAGGLDVYVAYPMTPSSSILHFLAAHDRDLGVAVVHPESEIAVANMAIGAAFAGARTMVGSSGGGFALMEEALSLAGMAEAPLLCVLSSRPGPSTGVPTYTEQGDLNFALNQGHGEFPRIVASPGGVEEAFYLAGELLNLAWEFQIPAILLTEKHLSESKTTVDIDVEQALWPESAGYQGEESAYCRYSDTEAGVSPPLFPPSSELIKWNSYEHDEKGVTTEEPAMVTRMHDKRARKRTHLESFLKDVRTVNVYGEGETPIFTYGSTTLSVREAMAAGGIEAKVVQPVYLEPTPTSELRKHRKGNPIVVELSSTGQFARFLTERCGIKPAHVITKYDGRPFDPDELAKRIKGVM